MAFVSNTSPLSYLLLIGQVDILRRLYQNLFVPTAVMTELRAPDAPEVIRSWAQSPPPWLITRDPSFLQPNLALHIGEVHAISLAHELNAERLIIDDQAGREAARSLGVPIVGTLGVLDLAAERGLVDLARVLPALTATNFRISRHLVEELRQRDAARRKA